MKILISTAALFIALGLSAAPGQFNLSSPDGELSVLINSAEKITYTLAHKGETLIAESPISMTLTDGTVYGLNSGRPTVKKNTYDNTIKAPFYKRAEIADNYNELTLRYKDFYLVFRAYDDGVAYRFISRSNKPFIVASEEAVFNFPQDNKAYFSYVRSFDKNNPEAQFFNSFENTYTYTNISGWEGQRIAFLPIVVESTEGRKICITEADLLNYPGMYLGNPEGSTSLKGVFANLPDEVEQGGHNMLEGIVNSRKPYIAECGPGEVFPWRVMIVSEEDKELTDNDMVYRLATPADENMDFSWVKPGKVAWEWWNHWNLYDVDFKTGINNRTYEYYIDFASEHGVEYVILDEGWAVNLEADLMQVVPEIDMEHLVKYGAERNVGLILWAGYWAFDRDMEGVCEHYSKLGVKGFKVDFMDRDDQEMVNFHYRAGQMAAKYGLLIDFHGTYKPTGLQRTWPNVLNFEGVFGLEQLKWTSISTDQVTYDVTIPFIRMVAGPMDYTQGAMRNATKSNYRPVNSEPMSQGTRCRQLAEYVVFESPINMLCDSPSNYIREPECTDFIANVPEVWDETIALDGKIAEYVIIARKKDDVWYVGGMTDWNERTAEVDLSFLGEGDFEIEIFCDGPNADKAARDYVKTVTEVPISRTVSVNMAPGGGFAMKISRK